MLTWNVDVHNVDHSSAETINEANFDFDGVGDRENIDKEDFLEREFKIGPLHLNLDALAYPTIIN